MQQKPGICAESPGIIWAGSREKLTGLNWGSFVTVNLPVTIGNIIGGAVMVGGVCFYLHGKAEG